jgi:hypothetical protein
VTPASRFSINSPSFVLNRDFLNRNQHCSFSQASSQPTMPNASEKYGNFDLIKRIKLDFTDVVVSKWRSRVTGLSVVHLDYEGMPA